MDEANYQRWWPLHIKAAKGEALTTDEQSFYDAGLCRLHREEQLHADPEKLNELEAEIARVERENAELASKRLQLETRLRRIESRHPMRQVNSAGSDA